MQVKQGFKEFGAFTAATVLSVGGSQLFGLIKAIVDLVHLIVNLVKRTQLNHQESLAQTDWNAFKTSHQFKHIAEKLQNQDLSLIEVQAYLQAKLRKTTERIACLKKSLLADAVALIPLAGAHLSWRIATDYRGSSFTPLFCRAMAQAGEHHRKLFSKMIFPLNKGSIRAGRDIQIPVRTSTKLRHINAICSDSAGVQKRPTVVAWHGNGEYGLGMAHRVQEEYVNKGYQVLAVTIGGYPGSPGTRTSEISLYQDIEAIKLYLQEKGVTEVAYHGLSLGGASALQAAAGESNAQLKTLFVVADQTFTSAKDVGGNVAGNFFTLAAPFGRGALQAAFPTNQSFELPGGKWIKTDGLNSLAKVQVLRQRNIPLYCISASQDIIMGRDFREGFFQRDFAYDLIEARYDALEERAEHLHKVKGYHGASDVDFFEMIPQTAFVK